MIFSFFFGCGSSWSCLQVLLLWSLPFFPLVFVVVSHSFCMHDQEFPIRCVYSILLLFGYVNCTAPYNLVYGFHLIGDLDWIQERDFLSWGLFCKNERVSTCSVILRLAENEAFIEHFGKNVKVSTCSGWLRFDILALSLCSQRSTSRGVTLSMLLRFTKRCRSSSWGFPWKLNSV